jgi:hypothetical protein
MIQKFFLTTVLFLSSAQASAVASFASENPDLVAEYRRDVLAIPAQMKFEVRSPLGSAEVSYQLTWDEPAALLPETSRFPSLSSPDAYFIEYYDRIFLAPGSQMNVGSRVLPLTCIWVHGQDNRPWITFDPLIPLKVMRILLVANDFACEGPFNPGWPGNGKPKETWDTYIEIQLKDLALYRPSHSSLRFRNVETELAVTEVGPVQKEPSEPGEPGEPGEPEQITVHPEDFRP